MSWHHTGISHRVAQCSTRSFAENRKNTEQPLPHPQRIRCLGKGWPQDVETITNHAHPSEFGFFTPFSGRSSLFWSRKLGWTAKNGHNDIMASLPIIGAISDMTFLHSTRQWFALSQPSHSPSLPSVASCEGETHSPIQQFNDSTV